MATNWKLVNNGSSAASVDECPQVAVVVVDDAPVLDLFSALPTVGERFALATYARSEVAVKLERAFLHAESMDLGFFAAWREVERRTRTACIKGDLKVGDGRCEPAFFGGHTRLIHDIRRWEEGKRPYEPVQLSRLREYESDDIEVVQFPPSVAMSNRFAGLRLVQPVVLSLNGLRRAEASGRISVQWDPR